jgi:hypothetical protein
MQWLLSPMQENDAMRGGARRMWAPAAIRKKNVTPRLGVRGATVRLLVSYRARTES